MNTTIKRHILSTLSVISVFATWQGVSASSYVHDLGYSGNSIPGSQLESSIQTSGLTEPDMVENISPSDGKFAQLDQPHVHFNEYLRSELGLKQQWALEQTWASQSPQIAKHNSQILVAVLDTGIDQDHEDLRGRVVAEINFTQSATTDDIYGHGTHVAGIIAGKSDNSLGIVGLAPESSLLNVKVADDKGRCQMSALADGIIWAVNNGANVINISIDLSESASRLRDAVDYAWRNGAVIVAAAGNDGSELPVYPAYYDNSIGVTAIRESGALAPLSNYGDWVDVAAPGFNIYSTLPNNSYGYKHGTSFATAYVSGLAALLFPIVTDINGDGRLNDEVRRAIEAGCCETGLGGTGVGCISVANSLAEIALIHGTSP